LRDAWRKETGLPVFLNADHHKSFELARRAIDAGYDSVQIDETSLSLEENMEISKKVVEYAKSVNSDISVEGGLGYIKGSSKLLKEKIEVTEEDMTSPEDARSFIEKTGVDRLAIVFGNVHGISSYGNPRLNIGRLEDIHKAIADIPLSLHGGSGIKDSDISATLSLGMSNIHINTEMRVAHTEALRTRLLEKPEETTPYKYLDTTVAAVQKVVEEKLKLFGAVDIL